MREEKKKEQKMYTRQVKKEKIKECSVSFMKEKRGRYNAAGREKIRILEEEK